MYHKILEQKTVIISRHGIKYLTIIVTLQLLAVSPLRLPNVTTTD